MNVTLIRDNEQGENLPRVEQGDTVEVSQVERPNKKCVLGPVKSLDTALGKDNYGSYNPTIPKKGTEKRN